MAQGGIHRDFDLNFDEVVRKFDTWWKQLPNRVSNMAANDFKENFRRQGYRADSGGIVRWKKRVKVKNKRDGSRAILIKTGRLRRGIQPAMLPGIARVINKVPYAEAHNEGAEKAVQVRAHKRYKWRKTKVKVNGKNKTLKQRTSVSRVKAHSRKMNLKARPFMITTKPLLHEIERYVDLSINKIVK